MSEDRIRVLRVIEYEGDRAAVEYQITRSLHGERQATWPDKGTVTIRAATLGTYPEILQKGAAQ